MPEVDLVFPRAFVEFVNPADETEVMKCDLTWLTSSYQCIFGGGCKGIYADAPDMGCCTLGAHFADKADEKRVAAYVDLLDEKLWQQKPQGRSGGRSAEHQVHPGPRLAVFGRAHLLHVGELLQAGQVIAYARLTQVLDVDRVDAPPGRG